jgi:PAS domain S-box-containing protein
VRGGGSLSLVVDFEKLVDCAPDGFLVVDAAGIIVYANSRCSELFGWPAAELVGTPVEQLIPQRFRDVHLRHREAYAKDPRVRPMGSGLALFAVRRDGAEFPAEVSLSPADFGGTNCVLCVVRDVTARVELETRMREAQERLHEERRRLAVASDRERIGMDLHDGVIQSLYSIGMAVAAFERETTDPVFCEKLSNVVDAVDEVIEDIRTYIHGLRPGMLADWQLARTLRLLGDDLASHQIATEVNVDVDAAGAVAWCASDIALVAREVLSNVARHSGASNCRVRLGWEPASEALDRAVVLEISDDGRGFDPANVTTGMGLANLRKRVTPLGGEVEVDSAPHHGTTVRVRFPA